MIVGPSVMFATGGGWMDGWMNGWINGWMNGWMSAMDASSLALLACFFIPFIYLFYWNQAINRQQ